MRLQCLILVVISVALLPWAVLAQDCIDYQQYLRWLARYDEYRYARCVDVVGDRAYVGASGDSGELVILDVSDPSRPAFLGSVALPGHASDAVMAIGEMVYVANWNGGLQIIDVSDPAAPSIAGSFATEFSAEDVAATAGVVLVSEMDQPVVHVVDVSDPSSPRAIAVVTIGGEVTQLEAANGHAYLLDYNYPETARLHVVDLADPAQPVQVGFLDFNGYASGLDVSDGFAYLIMPPDLVAVDVRDPSDPVVVSSVELPGVKRDVHAAGGLAFAGGPLQGNVSVVDVSSPTSPRYLAEIPLSGTFMEMDRADHRLITVSWNFGLNVFDVTTPVNPPKINELTLENGISMSMVDRRIYAMTLEGLRIIDATIPQDATILGGVDLGGGSFVPPIVIGDLAYVVGGEAGLNVIDVTDPVAPTIVGHWDASGEAEHLVRSGEYLLATVDIVGSEAHVLEVLSLADPHSPRTIGSLTLPEGTPKVYAGNDHAYFTVGSNSGWTGMKIVDLAVPEEPQIVGEIKMPGYEHSFGKILVDGDIAYFYSGLSGLVSIDVSDPTLPRWLDSVRPISGVGGLAAVGGYLYFSSGPSLLIFDVTDPTGMQVVGTGFIGGYPNSVVVDDGMVAALDSGSGLHFFYPHCDGVVSVMLASFTARVESGAVSLDWRTSSPTSDQEFRLIAVQDGRNWPVDVQAGAAGAYHAVDRSPRRDPSFPVRYDLYLRSTGGADRLLASETVDRTTGAPGARLSGASPNPFNPSTVIEYSLDIAQPVCLEVFDTRGRLVSTLVNASSAAGRHEVEWNGRDSSGRAVSSGVYIYRLDAGGRLAHGRMTLVR